MKSYKLTLTEEEIEAVAWLIFQGTGKLKANLKRLALRDVSDNRWTQILNAIYRAGNKIEDQTQD